jgi:hypothetical protein
LAVPDLGVRRSRGSRAEDCRRRQLAFGDSTNEGWEQMAETTTTVPTALGRALQAALKPVGEQDAALPGALADYVLTGTRDTA